MPTDLTDELPLSDLEQIRHSAYQEALHQAWFASSLEQTKSIFTLASAGVGLALTLLFGLAPEADIWIFGWLAAAGGLLAATAIFCIWLFRANAKLVMKLIANEDESATDGLVGRLALIINILFGLGIAFLVFASFAKILFKVVGVK
jgi:hypothetical protein